MQTECITESTDSPPIRLSSAQADALQAAGRRLASTKAWWGNQDEDGESPERTVIRCRPVASGKYVVRVSEAVGIVVAGDIQLIVSPKINQRHFLYLLNASERLPRFDPQKGTADADQSFWQLVARWYLDQLQLVVRRDLIRDYREAEARLGVVRGCVLPLRTARSYYRGDLHPTCRFEEFDADNSLNRVLKAAAIAVGASTLLPMNLRQRALWLLRPFDDVSDLRPGDLAIGLERRNSWYADALTLARSILIGQGRALAAGPQAVWTFLFRTPDLVEEGVRRVLARHLEGYCVTKSARQLLPLALTLNPDLVFDGGVATGDIKYKLGGTDWHRGDLYQAVAFAAGFETTKAMVLGFASSEAPMLPKVQIGAFEVMPFAWRAYPDLEPEEAARVLVSEIAAWLSGLDGVGVLAAD